MSVAPHKLHIVFNGVFIFKDNKILLLKRNENEILAGGMWATPGGKSEKGSDCFINLKREVKEETQLEIQNIRFFSHDCWPRKDDWVMGFFWLCEWKSGEVKLNHEHTDFKWVGPNDFQNLEMKSCTKDELTQAFKKIQS